ncbi:MAG: hypothetical protein V3U29_04630, partial [Phycisphaeraceae bacterium]
MNKTRWFLTLVAAALVFAAPVVATPTFSLDYHGPAVFGPGPFTGIPDTFGLVPIDEGSILTTGGAPPGPNPPAFGPLAPPGVMVTAVASTFGSVPGGLGIVPGFIGAVEVDALSYGVDSGTEAFFSVDEFASGDVVFPGAFPPDVLSEGALGALEASGDTFVYTGPF